MGGKKHGGPLGSALTPENGGREVKASRLCGVLPSPRLGIRVGEEEEERRLSLPALLKVLAGEFLRKDCSFYLLKPRTGK